MDAVDAVAAVTAAVVDAAVAAVKPPAVAGIVHTDVLYCTPAVIVVQVIHSLLVISTHWAGFVEQEHLYGLASSHTTNKSGICQEL